MSTADSEPVASPCVRQCTLDDDDVCVGCFRHLDEICDWGTACDSRRREILEQAAARGRRRNRD